MMSNDHATTAPRVAIIVLTWNQRDLTLDCLRSLAELRHPHVEVVVVDNGSCDGTADAVRSGFPSAGLIENGENLGYVGGNNAGIAYALTTPADYVILLNNDTVVDPEMVGELLCVMERDRSIGAAGPKMLYFDQPDTIWCAGNRIDWHTGESVRLQAEQPDAALPDTPLEVDYVTGCALCLRREVIEQIGLLDTRFFIYYEETDWCRRAADAGWRVVYVPRARLWHKVSAAMGTSSPATDYYMTRNVLLFLARNRRGFGRIVSLAGATGYTLKIVAAYTVRHRSEHRLRSRNVRLLALRDALLGRWGRMGADIERICYPRPS